MHCIWSTDSRVHDGIVCIDLHSGLARVDHSKVNMKISKIDQWLAIFEIYLELSNGSIGAVKVSIIFVAWFGKNAIS